jgi:hypothetical protein
LHLSLLELLLGPRGKLPVKYNQQHSRGVLIQPVLVRDVTAYIRQVNVPACAPIAAPCSAQA